jgi:SPX domain protein involved in polyphosphate accumulation
MTLIHSLCVMLQTTPFHKENYSRLIIGVIVQYYQQCSARFKGESRISDHSHHLVAEQQNWSRCLYLPTHSAIRLLLCQRRGLSEKISSTS